MLVKPNDPLTRTSWDFITEKSKKFRSDLAHEQYPISIIGRFKDHVSELINTSEVVNREREANLYAEQAKVKAAVDKNAELEGRIQELTSQLDERNRLLDASMAEIVRRSKWPGVCHKVGLGRICLSVPYCFCWPLVGLKQCKALKDQGKCAQWEGCLLPSCCCCVGAAINRQRIQMQSGMESSFLANLLWYLTGCCNACLVYQEKIVFAVQSSS